jgi:hypothetical protein
VNYPSDEIESEWYAEWQKMPREQQFSLQEYSHYAIRKACDWTAAHAKQQKRIDELEYALDEIWACANSGYSLDDLKSKIAGEIN